MDPSSNRCFVDEIEFSEDDIRPSKLMAEKQEDLLWDRNFLLAKKNEWEFVDCPSCQSDNFATFGEKEGFVYVNCLRCRTVYTNPRPSQELSHQFYQQSRNYAFWNKHIFPATENVRRERIFKPRARRVIDYCKSCDIEFGSLIDVGAAYGTFCEEIKQAGLFRKVYALEPTPDLASTCRSRGLDTFETPIEDLSDSKFFDVVTAFEVLEHLYAPNKFISRCRRLLRPNGLLILTCPNVLGFDVTTLGLQSGTFDHEHVNYFHPDSLSSLMESCSFRVLAVETPGQLDADIVRKNALLGRIDLSQQRFLHHVLIEKWETLGAVFQDFLSKNLLSSHMWIVGQRVD